MNATIDFSKQAGMRDFIAQLDQAIEMARDLNRQLDCIDQFLDEQFGAKLAA